MRIAVNTRFLIKNKLEGIGWFSYETLRRMVLQHPEVEFVFLFDREFDPGFLFGPNVTGKVLFPPARHPALWYAWFEFSVPGALKKIRPDAFLSPDGFLSLSAKIPQLLVIHDLAFEHFPQFVDQTSSWYYRHFTPKYVDKAAKVVTVSEFTRQDVINRYGTHPDKVLVAHNGCKEIYRPISASEQNAVVQEVANGVPYFLFAGALHPRKNVGNLFLAFDKFRKDTGTPFKLVIAGRKAWDYSEIFEIWNNLVFRDDVIFLGHLPAEQLARVTASAFGVTYVSWLEGFGLPILEALNSDVPVITSNVTSMPEVAGNAGLLVPPGSPEAIAEAMKKLVRQTGLRQELIAKGRLQRERFSWDFTAEKLWQALLAIQ